MDILAQYIKQLPPPKKGDYLTVTLSGSSEGQ